MVQQMPVKNEINQTEMVEGLLNKKTNWITMVHEILKTKVKKADKEKNKKYL